VMSAVAVLPSFLRWQSLPFRVLRVWVFWPRTCWRVWAEASATRGREKNPVTSILEEVNRRSIEAGCAKGGKGLSREWHRRNEHLYVTSPQFHYHFASWYVYAKLLLTRSLAYKPGGVCMSWSNCGTLSPRNIRCFDSAISDLAEEQTDRTQSCYGRTEEEGDMIRGMGNKGRVYREGQGSG